MNYVDLDLLSPDLPKEDLQANLTEEELLQWYTRMDPEQFAKLVLDNQSFRQFNPSDLFQSATTKPTTIKPGSKKDKIIQANLQAKEASRRQTESRRLESLQVLLKNNPSLPREPLAETWIPSFEFEENSVACLMEFLQDPKVSKSLLMSLYLKALELDSSLTKPYRKLLRATRGLLSRTCPIFHQMVEAASFMPPLSPYEFKPTSLEPWQMEILTYIKEGKSVLVVAPTSSGKTVCATYAATAWNPVLYLVPSSELSLQVYALFGALLKGQVALLNPRDEVFPPTWKVLVATPYEFETWSGKNSCEFQYAVFDEIQLLNDLQDDVFGQSACYERAVGRFRGPVLALTATLANPKPVRDWLSRVSGRRTELVEVATRPVIARYWSWEDGSLKEITRLDAVAPTSLPPYLCIPPATLYSLANQYKPSLLDSLTRDRRLTLEDMSSLQTDLIPSLPDLRTPETQMDGFSLESFHRMVKGTSRPTLVFIPKEADARKLYGEYVDFLRRREQEEYPHHYDCLGWLAARRNEIEAVWKSRVARMKNIPPEEESRLRREFWIENTARISSGYLHLLEGYAAGDPSRRGLYTRLAREFNDVESIEDLDEYECHPDWTFFSPPLGASQAKAIRRQLIDALRAHGGSIPQDKFSFNSVFLRGLIRGVCLYTASLPTAYQRVIISLVKSRLAPVIVSDGSLSYGVNLPVKTCVIVDGDSLDLVRIHQMAGRAGRRGLDRESHVVFYGTSWTRALSTPYSPFAGTSCVGWHSGLTSLPTPVTFRGGVDTSSFGSLVAKKDFKPLWNLRGLKNPSPDVIESLRQGDWETWLREVVPGQAEAISTALDRGRIESPETWYGLYEVGEWLRRSRIPQARSRFEMIRDLWMKYQL